MVPATAHTGNAPAARPPLEDGRRTCRKRTGKPMTAPC